MPEARSGVVDNVRADGTSMTSTCVDGPHLSEVPLDVMNIVERIATLDHRSLLAQLRRLVMLVDRIAPSGERRRELTEVKSRFRQLHAALDTSLTRERDSFFPIVGRRTTNPDSCKDVADFDQRVAAVAAGYDEVRRQLQELRGVTGDFFVPSDGCPYESCYRGLENLDRDALRHLCDVERNLLPALRALLATR